MPVTPDKINKNDELILKSFFQIEDKKPIKLIEEWRSTNWINQNGGIVEFANRTKMRLEKLHNLSFLQKCETPHESLINYEWYPTYSCLYYILSKMEDNDKIKDFIIANRKIANFETIVKHIQKSGMKHVLILIKDIKECIKNMKYKKIRKIIKEFFEEIHPKYLDWDSEIDPKLRQKVYNPKSKKYEIY